MITYAWKVVFTEGQFGSMIDVYYIQSASAESAVKRAMAEFTMEHGSDGRVLSVEQVTGRVVG